MSRSTSTAAYLLLRRELIAAREAAGLTQLQVAERIDRPQSFVAKYETGERRLDLVELVEIAAVLKMDLSALVARVANAVAGPGRG